MTTADLQALPDQNTDILNGETALKQGKIIKLAPSRPAWLFFLLMLASFGTYTFIWLFFRTREFKFILKNSIQPWLWIFVPLAAIVQLFALPRFVKHLNALETKANLPTWNAWHKLWYILVIAITIIINMSDKIDIPTWTYFIFLILWSFAFTVADQRIAKVKKTLTQYEYKKYRYSISITEGLTLLILLPFTLLISHSTLLPSLNKIQSLSENSIYEDKENNFILHITERNWSTVKNGTHSSSDSVLELHGPLSDMYFIVLHHPRGKSVNSIMQDRIYEFSADKANCRQIRKFSKNGESIIAKGICTGRDLGEEVMDTFTVIETKSGLFELYGHMSSQKEGYNQHEKSFQAMAAGFSPL